jgi:outer membrane protein
MNKLQALAAATLIAVTGSSYGQKAGSWSASIGFTQLTPSGSSGNLTAPSLPGTQASVNSNSQVTGAINYMFTDNMALSVPVGMGFVHDVTGAGAIAGVGKIATTKALPVTLLAQYRFMEADAKFRPYVGAGATYASFFDTRGTGVLTALTNPGGTATTLSFESKLVPTVQLGAMLNLGGAWYLDVNYTKTSLSTRGTLSTGQTLDMTLDPGTWTVGAGYRF